ncbi:hypothetical protein GCM10027290_66960 [Micromonospora sonneratiae]|uniref:Prepilin peptidase n=1 Tax=Micromonospora sonneratiae TaxID=1184706 RepID=A0ABW3YNH1_9ACTN
MNSLASIGLGVAGAIVGVPMAAIAHGVTDVGPVRLPARWWAGGPTRPRHLLLTVALVAVAAATIGASVPPTLALPAFWLFAVVGIGLSVVDVRCRRLPHRLTGALWASSSLCFIAATMTGSDVGLLVQAVSAGFATAIVMLAVALALPGQLGLGDVVLAGAIAFNLGWLGWRTAVLGLVAGLLLQGAIVLAAKIRQRSGTLMPIGPALVSGWLLAVLLAA